MNFFFGSNKKEDEDAAAAGANGAAAGAAGPATAAPEPEKQLDMDDVKRKRLARFAALPDNPDVVMNNSSANQVNTTSSSSSSSSSAAAPAAAPQKEKQPGASEAKKPASISSSTPATTTAAAAAAPAAAAVAPKPKVPLPEWLAGCASRVLGGNTMEVDSATAEDFEGMLIGRLASTLGGLTVAEFIVLSWNRMNSERNSAREFPERTEALAVVAKTLVSYAVIALQNPDMFPDAHATSITRDFTAGQLVPLLMLPETDPNALQIQFLVDIVDFVAASPEDTEQLFRPLFVRIMADLRVTDILNKHLLRLIELMIRLTGIPALAAVAAGMVSAKALAAPGMNSGRLFEQNTLLGTVFHASCLQDDNPAVAESLFPMVFHAQQRDIDSAIISMRGTLGLLYQGMHKVALNLTRNKTDRASLLGWFANALMRNTKRSQSYLQKADRLLLSSLGFTVNISAVLLKFCEPLFALEQKVLKNIDASYCMAKSRLDISAETRLGISVGDVDKWLDKRNMDRIQGFLQRERNELGDVFERLKEEVSSIADAAETKDFHFVTEIFFLTARAMHLGPLAAISEAKLLNKELQNINERKKELEGTKFEWQNTPQAARNQFELDQLTKAVELYSRISLCIETTLQQDEFLAMALRYANLAAYWLLQLAHGATPENASNGTRLVPPPPALFAIIPEYLVDMIPTVLEVAFRSHSDALRGVPLDNIVTFYSTFIDNQAYIRPPYLRSHFVKSMFMLFEKPGSRQEEMLHLPSVRVHLSEALMHFYVDCENTGTHTQFYDKFTDRFYAGSLLVRLWEIPYYRQAIATETNNTETFIKFVNALLNDATYLFTESISLLPNIRNVEVEMRNKESWEKLPAAERTQKTQTLEREKGQVTWLMQSGNLVIKLLSLLSTEIVAPFCRPELVQRVADMLNKFLTDLVGPKCVEIKVNDPLKLNFNPRELLATFAEIYINFGTNDAFITAVVADQRSYSRETFERVARTLSKHNLVNGNTKEAFQHLVKKLEAAAASLETDDDILGEIPDDFVDPIMSTLMTDPVKLPSNHTVDRAVITRHLLSDSTDPFTRGYLDVSMLVPDTELKARVDAWIKERRELAKNSKQ